MDIRNLEFRKLDREGVATLVEWAVKEGWNAGPHDAEVFFTTDPNGFYGYFLGHTMVAGGAIVSYSGTFGFMGLFIVTPEYRGKGIGRKLWYQRRDMLLSRLNPGAPIGMDGVVAMQPFYAEGGFHIAFRDERHRNTGKHFDIPLEISPLNNSGLNEIYAFDSMCFGTARKQFLDAWLQVPGMLAFQYQSSGNLEGFVMMRQANEGYKIGPLFAKSPRAAEALYQACLNAKPGASIYIDIPLCNLNAIALAEKFNTTYVFECARMYYGNPPDIPWENVYGITTFEVG